MIHLLIAGLLGNAAMTAPPSRCRSTTDPILKSACSAFAEYLVPPKGCPLNTAPFLDWPAGSLRICEYTVNDAFADGTKPSLPGLVYLAKFTPEQLRAWFVVACAKVQAVVPATQCAQTLALRIRGASGAQFPVAGIVWEDQACGDPRGLCKYDAHHQPVGDGVFEPYIFRNGVTVRITAPIRNGEPNRPGGANDLLMPSEADLQTYLVAPIKGISSTVGVARVASTSRADFARYTKRSDIPIGRSDALAATTWSNIVGKNFRSALSSGDNILIDATACALYKWPAGCR